MSRRCNAWAVGPSAGLPLTWHAVPGWEPPAAPAPGPLVAIDDPCAIRRRAIATLAAHGVPATVVGDAGCLAGVLDIARTGEGVALLAAVGPAPHGLTPYAGLPSVTPIPMSALARPGDGRGRLRRRTGSAAPGVRRRRPT